MLLPAKDSQYHWPCPEPGLLGSWPIAQPPWQPSTNSHHRLAHPRETIPEPTDGLSSCSHSPPASWPWPFLFREDRIQAPGALPSWSCPLAFLRVLALALCTRVPVHLGSSPPCKAPLPTWTAGVPAAPAGSRSALSARPVTAAASVPGCGPHPAGSSRTENRRISLGRGCLAAQSRPLFSVPSFQLLFLRLPRTTSILFSIAVGCLPPNLPSMHQSNQHLFNCPAT